MRTRKSISALGQNQLIKLVFDQIGFYQQSTVEAAFVGPEAEARVGDVEDFLAIYCVPTVLAGVGVIFSCHFGKVAVLVVHGFDLLAGEVAGTVANCKTAFAGAVDEMGGGA